MSAPTRIDPARNDPFYRRFALGLCRGNAAVTAFVYFLVSYVASCLLGMRTGHFWGRDGLEPMYANLESSVNLGLLVPVGVFLLVKFHAAVAEGFGELLDGGAIPAAGRERYLAFLAELESDLARPGPFRASLALAALLNLYVFFFKAHSWHCVDGGWLGVYASVFKFINFFYIFFISMKSYFVVRALRRLPEFGLEVRPLHPDEASGLAPAGRIAFSVNWFLALLMFYLTFVALFDPFFSRNRPYVLLTFALTPVVIAAFYRSLWSIHLHMEEARQRFLGRLSRDIDEFLAGTGGPPPDAQCELYPLVREMATFPFRVASAVRFVTTIMIPFCALLVQFAANIDSLPWWPRLVAWLEEFLTRTFGF